ncbi:Alpha-(1,3)-fucosyltransferase C [Aphelenchoides fujianensis]|nr:Alpha-(1,3)-fucosyltransferase C [Aphelenchoides fujianensis]
MFLRLNFTRFAAGALLLLLVGVFLLSVFGPKNNAPIFYDVYRPASTDSSPTGRNDTRPPVVLFWTKVFGEAPNLNDHCPLASPCTFTTDRSKFEEADAVVFHSHDIRVDDLPGGPANSRQKFVFYSMEAAPALNFISQKTWWKKVLKFHWVMSYMREAHVRAPYGGFLVEPEVAKQRGFRPIANFSLKIRTWSSSRRSGRLSGSSRTARRPERIRVAKQLSAHFPVDVGGKCAFNESLRDLCPRNADCDPLISSYFFYLAFENANCLDYVTEKFDRLLPLPVVPIVLKRSVYQNRPPNSAHLRRLMDTPAEFFKLLEWRNRWAKADWNADGYRMGICGLCERLQKERHTKTPVIPDLKRFYRTNSPCWSVMNAEWSQ